MTLKNLRKSLEMTLILQPLSLNLFKGMLVIFIPKRVITRKLEIYAIYIMF